MVASKFKELWNLHFDSKERLLSVSLSTEIHKTSPPTPIYAKACPGEVISSFEKLKNGLIQNGVRESVKIVTHNAPKTSEKINFSGVKTPEEKKKEAEQANEPGFIRKYVSSGFYENATTFPIQQSGTCFSLLVLFLPAPCLPVVPNKSSSLFYLLLFIFQQLFNDLFSFNFLL